MFFNLKELSKFQIDLLKKLRETELIEFMINRNNPCKCGGTYITKECGCFQVGIFHFYWPSFNINSIP